ncbi:hypothetical protein [Carboxydocella sp. ULO1]|uniref:hypothetical protein n=1 Tax=Carboxydocella sp. ULO1 TaxID=1926599 RepID=UPI0013566D21|nr:hypothetical protein [Carboxydocella sp. ULO1]
MKSWKGRTSPERTLRRYLAAYLDLGYDGLLPKTRSDKGSKEQYLRMYLTVH